MQTTGRSNRKYILACVFLLIAGLTVMFVCVGLTSLGGMVQPAAGGYTPVFAPPEATPGPTDPIASVDDILNRALTGSLAYNAPESMQVDETVTIQLLLNPSISEAELGQQIEESGTVTTGTVQVTPLMKAELIARDEAFDIVPLHDTAEQPISTVDTTRWQWQVTAHQEGTQRLTLVVYRLVKYDGRDYWREVETYRSDITVNVTWVQRLGTFDWQWLVGILATSGFIPFAWRWYDKRRQPRKPSA